MVIEQKLADGAAEQALAADRLRREIVGFLKLSVRRASAAAEAQHVGRQPSIASTRYDGGSHPSRRRG